MMTAARVEALLKHFTYDPPPRLRHRSSLDEVIVGHRTKND